MYLAVRLYNLPPMEFIITGLLAPLIAIGGFVLFAWLHPAIGILVGLVLSFTWVILRAKGLA
jgi:hypothetical protein